MSHSEHIRRGVATKAEKHAARYAEQQAAALKIIERAARLKQSCPSNARLAAAMGLSSSGAPSLVLKRMAENGVIQIGRDGNERVVRIVASGLQTAGEMTAEPRKDAIGSVRARMTRKDRFAEALADLDDIELAARRIGVAHDTARRLFDEICADLRRDGGQPE